MHKKLAPDASSVEKIDADKRAFLKVAGIAGVGIIAATLPEKANALSLGGAPVTTISGVKNVSGVAVNPVTENTLATLKTDTSAIAASEASIVSNVASIPAYGRVSGAGSVPVALASDQSVLPVAGTMSFATPSAPLTMTDDDSTYYLRRAAKLLESRSTVDGSRRQRIVIDGSTDMTITGSAAQTTVAGQGLQMYQDIARNEFANGIRKRLAFS